MIRCFLCCLLVTSWAWAQPEPSFSRDIAPWVLDKCIQCHGPEKQKGGYRVDTFERFIGKGESGEPVIVSNQPGKSLLYQLVTSQDLDDRMPQKAEPLSGLQTEVLKRWILAGARFDGPSVSAPITTFAEE